MKYLITILLINLIVGLPSLAATQHDFGMRLRLGSNSGDVISNTEVGLDIDFLLYKNIYMVMGATFLIPPSQDIRVAINSIGLEYNLPLGQDDLLLSATFNRSYVKDSQAGFRSSSFHLGYKKSWLEDVDVVLLGGIMSEALLVTNPSPLMNNAWFVRTAIEFYY
jgi:hypothetical protein